MTDTPQVLPPFTADDARCAKCGNTASTDYGVATSFGCVPDADRLRAHAQQNPISLLLNGGDPDDDTPKLPAMLRGYEAGQEFLARCCGRCGFSWLEACLDDPNLAFRSAP